MDIEQIRTERKKLEAEIFSLCEDFRKRTGIGVVVIKAETSCFRPANFDTDQTYLTGVRVGIEPI